MVWGICFFLRVIIDFPGAYFFIQTYIGSLIFRDDIKMINEFDSHEG
ncbi:hypothetical protein EC847_1128 [Scandinavium goeteborgense]|uniref:Uncharacterized protein n=1 Tax=Scandinavium goeteborgense TaxID=1851514 RepID=A0A4R6EDY3_SCAGO|nr:hypothetical protein EC847_1128 [Scandinavium goeteborgense]